MLKDKLKPQVVSFAGVLEVVHSLPGRIRLRIPSLKGRPRALAEFESSLKRLDGIVSVTTNATLGTALVTYDAEKLTPSIVVAAATHGFDFETAFRRQQSLVGGELKAIHYAINQAVLKRSGGVLDLPALMTVLLVITFVRGILGRGGAKFSPLAVIWWLHQSLTK
jgi:copper chaperone CopZ